MFNSILEKRKTKTILGVALAALVVTGFSTAASAATPSYPTVDGEVLDGSNLTSSSFTVEVPTESDIQAVKFILDGEYLGKDTEAPFSWDVETTEGAHKLKVRHIKDGENIHKIVSRFTVGETDDSGEEPDNDPPVTTPNPSDPEEEPESPTPDPTEEPDNPATPGQPPVETEYPLHTNIVATTFWVGEIFNADLSDGSQVCSTYDSEWALSHTGVEAGSVSSDAAGCAGSPVGGCDGVSTGSGDNFSCETESRSAENAFLPTEQSAPLENPFYLDLPYDDLNDPVGFDNRCDVIPWAAEYNEEAGADNCDNGEYSYMKNSWVQITGPNGDTCYGQVEDAGPSSGDAYHDSEYVFGENDARPANDDFSNDSSQGAGMDVSPALNGCLGFSELDGASDTVDWRFISAEDVPEGPWKEIVTTSQVNN